MQTSTTKNLSNHFISKFKMASYKELCDEKLSKLINEDTRMPALQEMKDLFVSIPRDEMSRAANSLQLPLIFDCLNDSNSEQIDLACEVLSICMTTLNLGESTNKYGSFLERALNHPHAGVKMMALNEIKRNIENDDVLVSLSKRQSLLINIIKCIADSDLGVSKNASEIMTTIGHSTAGIKQLLADDVQKEFHETVKVNEVVRLRVYEVMINVCAESESNFMLLKSTGFLAQILEELDNNDILLRLNVLELLTQLGKSKHGFDYLEQNQILKKLSLMFENNDITVELCEPGVLKFFGNLAYQKPIEILAKYPNVFQRLFNNIENNQRNFTILGVSLETLGYIGLSNEGKIALDSTGATIVNTIKGISKSSISYPSEVKVRALNCLENLLRVMDHNNQITTITRTWYGYISDNPMDFIWSFAKNPFAEFRIAGFGILNALAGQMWGHEAIKNTPGFVEFLLDRSAENTKECKEAKFSIIELLSTSPVFDPLTIKQFQTYIREGPFYVPTVLEVAIERNE